MECEYEEAVAGNYDNRDQLNASARSAKQRAAHTLFSNGYRLVHGLGAQMRYNHKPIDTLWVHEESDWWQRCTWKKHESHLRSISDPMWTPSKCEDVRTSYPRLPQDTHA